MSVLDHEAVEGTKRRSQTTPTERLWPAGTVPVAKVLAAAREPVYAVEATWLRERPVYRLVNDQNTWLADARTGRPVPVDAALAALIAAQDYVGPVQADPPQRLAESNLEARGHAGAIWRVHFADPEDTTLYLSAVDGRILERRNNAWRWFDIAWMLHIMDYSGRKDFNHPLVIASAAGGLWIALTGLWLLGVSFRLKRLLLRRA